MILLFAMIIFIFYLINKNIDNHILNKNAKKILILAFLFQAILLVIYRIDLTSHGIEVYYSDATDYWNATIRILKGLSTKQYNATFYVTCALIQKLSPFIWVGWDNIFNILCVDMSIVLCAITLYKKASKESNYKNIYIFLILNLFNPLIFYSLMRNLKDAEFLLLTVIIGTGLQEYLDKKKTKTFILYIFELIICTYLLYEIRPWGFIIGALPLLIMIFKKGKQKYETITISILIIVMALLFPYVISKFKSTIEMWAPIVMQSASNRGGISNLIGVFKLLFGPGPIRSIYGDKYFLYYLPTGNIMCFIGSIMWWIEFFALTISFIVNKQKNKSYFYKFLLMFLITYFMIYTMQYGGSTELRFRGVLYVTLSALLLSDDNTKITKQSLTSSIIIFIIMFLCNMII